MDSLVLKAHGKINLALDIVGKFDNGYHAVDMIMQKIQLHDLMTFKKMDQKVLIECDHPEVPKDESNLAYKAIDLLRKAYNLKAGIHITIEKKLPVAAGLGGGSSNAAQAIIAYNQLYDLGLSKKEMQDIGVKVGADVPFFFEKDCCRATGIGDQLKPIQGLNDGWLVLCKPNISVSTKEIYEGLNYPLILRHPDVDAIELALYNKDLEGVGQLLGNVLEQVTLKRYSTVREIRKKMENSDALGVLMSGSGPTVFGIFKDYDSGLRIYKKLSNIYTETYLTRRFNGGNYEEY